MQDNLGSLHVAQELDPQPYPLAGPLDQARQVGHREVPAVWQKNHA